ncbi:MAG TPA: hypothetical protein VGI03_12345 [Verrucomicrobiae bacterium]|jgi:hypothetical protein
MAFSKTFERELNNLFRQRTDWLRRKLGERGVGKPPKFSRKKVNAGIKKLQEFASDGLADKLAKLEFDEYITSWKNYHVKGRGYDGKRRNFEKWFAVNFKNTKGLIYAFWGEQKNVSILDARVLMAIGHHRILKNTGFPV